MRVSFGGVGTDGDLGYYPGKLWGADDVLKKLVADASGIVGCYLLIFSPVL